MTEWHILFGGIATAIAVFSHIPYLYGIFRGTAKPHAFSWGLWALQNGIVFFAQLSAGGGPGAWAAGFTFISCTIAAIGGLRALSVYVRPIDYICLALSLIAIPLWAMSDNPLYAVILLTISNVLAFIPTWRKAWHRPYEEVMQTYGWGIPKSFFAALGMTTMNWTTLLYPVIAASLNLVMVVLLMYRRHRLKITTDITV
jgi:hypothetical protein